MLTTSLHCRRRLSSILGSWINLTVLPHSSSANLQFHFIIRYSFSPNLSFCISSHLLCNCLFECPFPSLAWKFWWYIQSRGLNFYGKRFALHRTLNSHSGLRGLEQEHFSDYFNHGYSAGGLFHSLGIKGSQMVHQCWCLTLVSVTWSA